MMSARDQGGCRRPPGCLAGPRARRSALRTAARRALSDRALELTEGAFDRDSHERIMSGSSVAMYRNGRRLISLGGGCLIDHSFQYIAISTELSFSKILSAAITSCIAACSSSATRNFVAGLPGWLAAIVLCEANFPATMDAAACTRAFC